MKFLRSNDGNLVFHLSGAEREMALTSLKQYPVLRTLFRPEKEDGGDPKLAESRRLLEEALKEEKESNRKALQEWLAQPGRWRDLEEGFEWHIESSRREWLLQIFNDIRVGSWNRLDCPDTLELDLEWILDAEKRHHFWIMEMAGYFQSVLLFDEEN